MPEHVLAGLRLCVTQNSPPPAHNFAPPPPVRVIAVSDCAQNPQAVRLKWYELPASLLVDAVKLDDRPYQAVEAALLEGIRVEPANPDVAQAIEVYCHAHSSSVTAPQEFYAGSQAERDAQGWQLHALDQFMECVFAFALRCQPPQNEEQGHPRATAPSYAQSQSQSQSQSITSSPPQSKPQPQSLAPSPALAQPQRVAAVYIRCERCIGLISCRSRSHRSPTPPAHPVRSPISVTQPQTASRRWDSASG